MTSVGEKGAGRECLICPECLTLRDNAGPGGAICAGQKHPHPQVAMQRYFREDVTEQEPGREERVQRVMESLVVHGNAYRDPDGPQFEGGPGDYIREKAEAIVYGLDALSEKGRDG